LSLSFETGEMGPRAQNRKKPVEYQRVALCNPEARSLVHYWGLAANHLQNLTN
jgi:hypothetical protein